MSYYCNAVNQFLVIDASHYERLRDGGTENASDCFGIMAGKYHLHARPEGIVLEDKCPLYFFQFLNQHGLNLMEKIGSRFQALV